MVFRPYWFLGPIGPTGFPGTVARKQLNSLKFPVLSLKTTSWSQGASSQGFRPSKGRSRELFENDLHRFRAGRGRNCTFTITTCYDSEKKAMMVM